MTISEERKDRTLIVRPEGRLDTVAAPSLEKYLKERYDSADRLILDMQKVEYISSAGLRVLIQAHKRMKEKDGMIVGNVCPQVMNVFEMTGYHHVLKIEEQL